MIKTDEDKIIDVKFHPKTNDQFCNKYVPFQMLTWRANTDASICASAVSLIHYITKYMSKGEHKGEHMQLITQNVFKKMQESDTLSNFIYKSLCELLITRD